METVDERAVGAFMERMMGDCTAAMVVLLAAVGDRHGLFRVLASDGAATPGELADRAGIDERYAGEWLSALAAAGYLTQEAGRYTLPAAHVPVLALDDTPASLGGPLQWLLGVAPAMDAVSEAMTSGKGVPADRYGPDLWPGMERLGAPMYVNALVPAWLPQVPHVQRALERGADVADLGCGAGRALIALAQAYPAGRYTGFDGHPPQVDRARANAERLGVGDRVLFAVRDAAAGLPEAYDVVLLFDVVHDAADPAGLLRAARESLRPGGTALVLELAGGGGGPVDALFHAVSLFYCLPVSLAAGGPGLGSLGMPEQRLAELAARAGFGSCRKILDSPPAHALFELTR